MGKAGRDAFHRERRRWFKLATRSSEHPDGIELHGTLAEQNTRYDIVARRFRAYSDGRSAPPKEKTWEELTGEWRGGEPDGDDGDPWGQLDYKW